MGSRNGVEKVGGQGTQRNKYIQSWIQNLKSILSKIFTKLREVFIKVGDNKSDYFIKESSTLTQIRNYAVKITSLIRPQKQT